MTRLLKGDRYTVSPCMDKYPPLDEVVRYDSDRANEQEDVPAPEEGLTGR